MEFKVLGMGCIYSSTRYLGPRTYHAFSSRKKGYTPIWC